MKDSYQDHKVTRSDPRNQLRGYPIISDQISRGALEIICQKLEQTLDRAVPGSIVEFGCYIGTTSLFIRRVLDSKQASKTHSFHVYDSFEGLPIKGSQDQSAAGVAFESGKLFASKKEFLNQFRAANLQPPIIHKGWFNKLTEKDVPEPIAFAFLDGDFYESIISSLRLVWPCMSKGGIIIIDDYNRPELPGATRAIRDFMQNKPVTVRSEQNLAIIQL